MSEPQKSVLVVDDEESFREVVRFHLEEAGYLVHTAPDGQQALEVFQRQPVPVVLSDLKMPAMDGLKLTVELLRRAPETLVIVITAFGSIERAVEAMRAGAFDFLPKPVNRDHLKLVVARAFEHAGLRRQVKALEAERKSRLIYTSVAMEKVVKLAEKVARSDASVLIEGESGTGKELLARRIHELSDRASAPFVAVDCAAIPRDLMESDLFGHAKGAFTGASSTRIGRFREADGGTLFLDEIGELPLELQPKLLRALQQRTIDILGGEREVAVDVRVLAATNRDLAEEVENSRFRRDLFHRLNVVTLRIPPLRERPEDIPVLLGHFLKKFAPDRKLHPAAELHEVLRGHRWPGNVRELENLAQRIVLLAEDERLGPELLPEPLGGTGAVNDSAAGGIHVEIPPQGASLEQVERQIILRALQLNDYNQSRAARFLRIPRHVLLYRMRKFGIEKAPPRQP